MGTFSAQSELEDEKYQKMSKKTKILLKHVLCPFDSLSPYLSFDFILCISLQYWSEKIFVKLYEDVFFLDLPPKNTFKEVKNYQKLRFGGLPRL